MEAGDLITAAGATRPLHFIRTEVTMERKTYSVVITETYQRTMFVEATDEREAHRRASDAWTNGEYLLDEQDFTGVEFHVSEDVSRETDKERQIERKQ